ncbi:protein mono-ADP-ribosyltransferase PARP14-like [Argopecten irradians]|uniref:protein mono-ADP-ribosyltransferase PARP14-like n=1 Tax=Argopecten irradians TaxID=31199 RepID=UPI003715D162
MSQPGDTGSSAVSGDEDLNRKVEKIRLTIRKGLLQQEQADVLVTNSSGNLNLKAGRTTKALLDAGGETLQEQCNTNYPQGIRAGEVATTTGGNLNCQYVFYCFMTSWKDAETAFSKEVFCKCLQTCLKKADESGLVSMVIPALGTGQLKFPVKEILKLVLLCVSEFSKSKPDSTLSVITMVVYPKDDEILQEFREELKNLTRKLSKITDNKIDLEKRSEKIQIGKTSVAIVTGSIVEQKADVLVNLTNSKLRLNREALSRAFLEAAGEGLQTECDSYSGGLNSGDIAVTGGYSLSCVNVYHITLPHYSDKEKDANKQVLSLTVLQCLMQLEETKLRSIVFPCFAFGQHKYPDSVAATTFLQTVDEYIHDNKDTCVQDITLVIYPVGPQWKEVWQAFINELTTLKLRYCQNSDTDTKPVPVRHAGQGARPKFTPRYMYELKKKLTKTPVPQTGQGERPKETDTPVTAPAPPPPPVPVRRGSKKWLQMKYMEDICIPNYWLHHKGGTQVKKLKLSLEVSMNKAYVLKEADRSTKDAVIKLVQDTWEMDKVGTGKDARGLDQLGFTKIEVTKVQRVENLDLYEKYATERQRIFGKASKKGLSLTSVKNSKDSSGEVCTYTKMRPCLKNELFPEINEHYLFHGTRLDNIEKVLSQGLDNRMAGDNAMFGAGVYAAESSTKADQYSDSKDNRTSSPKKMLLTRMCLGEAYISKTPTKFRKPPCKECLKDSCAHKKFYDSVVGDGKWIFREFIVYDPRQSYPEFLITYIRK